MDTFDLKAYLKENLLFEEDLKLSDEQLKLVAKAVKQPVEKVEKVTQEVIDEIQNSLEETNKNYQPTMRFQNFGESSINIMVYCSTQLILYGTKNYLILIWPVYNFITFLILCFRRINRNRL